MSLSVNLRPAKTVAAALAAMCSMLAMSGSAFAQRVEKSRAERAPQARADAPGQVRTKDIAHKPSARASSAETDTRFSSDQAQRSYTSSARLNAGAAAVQTGAACENCPKPIVLRRKDRDCLRPKYPRERFIPAGGQGPTRCERK
jgi:hypothetical protein